LISPNQKKIEDLSTALQGLHLRTPADEKSRVYSSSRLTLDAEPLRFTWHCLEEYLLNKYVPS